MWFSSELNGKDHLERIHIFREGQGCSFYECLRRYGMEWFGKRSYFDQHEQSNQAMWMIIALARQSGQELNNHYIITNSPATSHIRRFFNASIRRLTTTYQQIAADQAFHDIRPSICDQMRREIASIKEESEQPQDQASRGDQLISDDDIAISWRRHAGCPHQIYARWLSWRPAGWRNHIATCLWPEGQLRIHRFPVMIFRPS